MECAARFVLEHKPGIPSGNVAVQCGGELLGKVNVTHSVRGFRRTEDPIPQRVPNVKDGFVHIWHPERNGLSGSKTRTGQQSE